MAADPTTLMNFVLFLAGLGGVVLLVMLGGLAAYMVIVVGVPWQHITFYALWVGLILSFCLTSVDLATSEKETKRAVVITQGVTNGILVVLLGLTVYNYSGDNFKDRMTYIYFALPISLIMSVVSLSAVAMNRLVS
jgi:hypothetical protein